MEWWLSGVYGPCKNRERREFWEELAGLYGMCGSRWCVGGDFNVVRFINEKSNRGGRLTKSMRNFNDFIQETELKDLDLLNAQFTWSNLREEPVQSWSKKSFGEIEKVLKEAEANIKELDRREGTEGLDFKARSKREELQTLVGDLAFKEEVKWRQKSKVEWAKEGDGINWAPISAREASWLKRPFEEAKVQRAVFDCGKDKLPGADGFSMQMFQHCWDILKEDIMKIMEEFFEKGIINVVTNETFICLIPKKSDFLKGAFVKDRKFLDAVLIANEVVEEGCLCSANFFVLINGRPRGKFQASRGLRQGDPLSPFLFTLVVDVLSRLMEKAQENDLINGLCIGQEKVEISHLQFADDTIFFLTEDEEVWNSLLQDGRFLGLRGRLLAYKVSGTSPWGQAKSNKVLGSSGRNNGKKTSKLEEGFPIQRR
ncbi:hypothetical protein ACFX1X_044959 [Malus domestica]